MPNTKKPLPSAKRRLAPTKRAITGAKRTTKSKIMKRRRRQMHRMNNR